MYDSLDELFGDIVGAVVPVYGVSVYKLNCSSNAGHIRCNRSNAHWDGTPAGKCPFRLYVAKEGSKWTIDESRSTYSHSHGPTRGILKNPDWLPKIRNPVARKKMGLAPLRSSTDTVKVRHQSTVTSVRFLFHS